MEAAEKLTYMIHKQTVTKTKDFDQTQVNQSFRTFSLLFQSQYIITQHSNSHLDHYLDEREMASSSGINFIRPPAAVDEDDDMSLPVGYRFRPTEEELVGHYLKMKLKGRDSLVSHIIGEIDICSHEPWDLPAFSLIKSDDKEWFFFSRPKYKQNNRNRVRSTDAGFWKITGKERVIKARDNITVLGKKRILPFFRGRVRRSEITNWVIHEYYIPQTHPNADQRDFELIRLKKKSDENADVSTCDEGEPRTYNASDYENQPHPAHIMAFQEEYDQPEEDADYFEMARDLLLGNTQSRNDNNRLQSGFGDNEPDDISSDSEFLESVIVDWEQDLCGETTHTTVFNDSNLPQPLKRVYVEDGELSSDTDTEVPRKQIMNLRRLTGGSRHTKESASSVNAVLQPYAQPRSQQSSINFTAEGPGSYYLNEQKRRTTYPREGKLTELKLRQSKPEPLAPNVAHLPQKTSMPKKGMEQTQNTTTDRRCSFITWQVIPLASPRSVYLFNTVLAVILFWIFCSGGSFIWAVVLE